MFTLRILISLLIFLQATDCNNSSEKIQPSSSEVIQDATIKTSQMNLESIVVEYYGGMRGHKEVMILSSDMISYSFSDLNHPKPILTEKEMPNELWSELNTSFDAKEFSKLKNGSSKVVFDGMDYIFTVKGPFGELKVTNPLEENVEMKNFFEKLKNQMTLFLENTPKKSN